MAEYGIKVLNYVGFGFIAVSSGSFSAVDREWVDWRKYMSKTLMLIDC